MALRLMIAAVLCVLGLTAVTGQPAANVVGLKTFQDLALTSVNLTEALYDAILEGNLDEAKEAYAASRPPYEQIEVLAGAFPNLDSDIDARPYAFTDGEAFPDEEEAREQAEVFKGFHRVEYLLFREENTTAAAWWAAALVNSSVALASNLLARDSFSAEDTWAGMIALATEIGAKKFSSEEETFSDLSVLIFSNNLKGIDSQWEAYEEDIEKLSPEIYERVESSLEAAEAALAPYVGKAGQLGGVTPYSQVPTSVRAALQKAVYAYAAALKEAAELIGVEEEAEEEEEEACTPSVQVAEFAAGDNPLEAGLDYFRALMPFQLQYAANLTAAIEAGNLAAARTAYRRSRPFYEQFEVLAPSFVQEDSDIDAREYAFDGGEASPDFKGFHRIERYLFRDGNLTAAEPYAEGLEQSLEKLEAILNNSTAFAAGTNFAGVIGVATEIVAKKISSEEETSSGLSHLIFYNNWKGIYSQTVPFAAGNATLKAALDSAVEDAAACLNVTTSDNITEVAAADVDAAFAANLANANYGNYSRATDEEKECIAQAGYRVRDAVLTIARAANVLDDCHPNYKSPLKSATPVLTFDEDEDAAEVPETIVAAPAESIASDDDVPSDDEAEAPAPASDDDSQDAARRAAAGAVGIIAAAIAGAHLW